MARGRPVKFTLEELLRQKAVLKEHLAWLEGKIDDLQHDLAADRGEESEVPPHTALQTGGNTPPDSVLGRADTPADPTVSTAEPEFHRGTSARETKLGCLVWFVAAAIISVIAATCLFVLYPEWDEEKARERLPAKSSER